LSEVAAADRIRVALNIADPALADRLAELLADTLGLRLVAAGEPADVVVTPTAIGPRADGEAALTARELEVLIAINPNQHLTEKPSCEAEHMAAPTQLQT
jgi:hypothetical protein